MSESDSKPPAKNPSPEESVAAATPTEPVLLPKPSRMRRFFLRHLPITVAAGILLLAAILTGLYFFASSSAFENYIRGRIVHEVETAFGGRVEIASFHWDLLHLEAEAGGVVIHGREAPDEAPYAQIKNVRVRWSMLGWWIPHFPAARSGDFQAPNPPDRLSRTAQPTSRSRASPASQASPRSG